MKAGCRKNALPFSLTAVAVVLLLGACGGSSSTPAARLGLWKADGDLAAGARPLLPCTRRGRRQSTLSLSVVRWIIVAS